MGKPARSLWVYRARQSVPYALLMTFVAFATNFYMFLMGFHILSVGSAAGVDPVATIILGCCLVCWALHGFLWEDKVLVLSSLLGMSGSLFVLILIATMG